MKKLFVDTKGKILLKGIYMGFESKRYYRKNTKTKS